MFCSLLGRANRITNQYSSKYSEFDLSVITYTGYFAYYSRIDSDLHGPRKRGLNTDKNSFYLFPLCMYLPAEEVLSGTWTPPPVLPQVKLEVHKKLGYD